MECKINLTNVSPVVSQMEAEKNRLDRFQTSIEAVISNCPLSGSMKAGICISLQSVVKSISTESSSMASMSKALEQVIALYRETEEKLSSMDTGISSDSSGSKNSSTADSSETAASIGAIGAISSFISWIWNQIIDDDSDEITPYEVDSIVYGERGEYGGNQGAPARETRGSEKWQEMYDIVRNYYPDMTEDQFDTFLTRMNSEGCGYVAITNTIFVYYEGRAAEFESTFGFPMYDDDGNLNFELLLVDFYATMDNTNGKGKVNAYTDYDSSVDGDKSSYDVLNDTSGYGTTISDQKKYLENYMKNHGVDVDVKTNASVDTSDIPGILSDGRQITIKVTGPINMYNEDGSLYGTIGQDVGHSMTVTGVTEDGKIIVSSWGKKYLLDPDEFSSSTKFSIIQYK